MAVEYPRKGIYQIALVTNVGLKKLCDHTGKRMLTVFVPTSPTPVTGYTAVVSEDEVVDLKMPIDQAFRMIVSGGVLIPEEHLPKNITVSELLPEMPVKQIEGDTDEGKEE